MSPTIIVVSIRPNKGVEMLRFLIVLFLASGFAYGKDKIKLVPVEAVDARTEGKSITLSIAGYLPNGCYSKPYVNFKKSKDGFSFEVRVLSYFKTDVMCTQAIKPFCMSVNLGEVENGSYDIVIQPKTRWEQVLTVFVDYNESKIENMSSLVFDNKNDRFFCSPSSRSSNM